MKRVLDHGHVRLEQFQGGDLQVVNAARVSFNQRSDTFDVRDAGLIRYLMLNKHGSPFEHNLFTFVIKCPIFVAREWQRHRIGSFNEVSRRYSTPPVEFYVPELRNVRRRVGQPGEYRYETLEHAAGDAGFDGFSQEYRLAEAFRWDLQGVQAAAYEMYQDYLREGVAPEQVRMFLPVGMYTEFWWTINARSLMNFLTLRTHETAQQEIRDYADTVETFFAELMPTTHQAWNETGRVAP